MVIRILPYWQAGSPVTFCSAASFSLRGCRVPSKALFTAKHLTVLGSFPNCSFKASRRKKRNFSFFTKEQTPTKRPRLPGHEKQTPKTCAHERRKEDAEKKMEYQRARFLFLEKCAPRELGTPRWEPPGALSRRVGSGKGPKQQSEFFA